MSACTMPPRDVRRLLVVRPGALGDALLTRPALLALRRRFPSARVGLFAHGPAARLLESEGTVDEALAADDPAVVGLFQPDGDASPLTRQRFATCDLAVVWTGQPAAPPRPVLETLGVPTLWADWRPVEGRHVADHLMATLASLGVTAVDPDAAPSLRPSREGQAWAEAWWARLGGAAGGAVVALHPGSGSPSKCWSPAAFARVARLLVVQGYRPLVIVGPADEAAAGALLAAASEAAPVVVREPPLAGLAALLGRCAAYLGNDSGVTHLAAAVGVPVVALFGPTDPARWRPRGRWVRVLRFDAAGAVLSPEAVVGALVEAATASGRRAAP